MKFTFAAIFLSLIAFAAQANEVIPQRFGVQYLKQSIADKPFVAFNFQIAAKDFPTMKFSTITAAIMVNNQLIVPAQYVYSKPPGTTISGSEVVNFTYQGPDAISIIQALRSATIIFGLDSGSTFTINLGALCASQPDSFADLMGNAGCP